MEMDFIKETDPEVAGLIDKELIRQQNTIELIASENIASKAVIAAAGTVLTNKYAEGKPINVFTTAAILLTKSKPLRLKELRNFLESSMPTSNPTVVLKQIWQYFYTH